MPIEQLQHAAVLFEDVPEQQLRFEPQGATQFAVEFDLWLFAKAPPFSNTSQVAHIPVNAINGGTNTESPTAANFQATLGCSRSNSPG